MESENNKEAEINKSENKLETNENNDFSNSVNKNSEDNDKFSNSKISELARISSVIKFIQTPLQLAGFVVLIIGSISMIWVSPEKLRIAIALGSIGVSFIVFPSLFSEKFLKLFPREHRFKLVYGMFTTFLVFIFAIFTFALVGLLSTTAKGNTPAIGDPIPVPSLQQGIYATLKGRDPAPDAKSNFNFLNPNGCGKTKSSKKVKSKKTGSKNVACSDAS